MTSGWYYLKAGASAGQQAGPLSWEQLAGLVQAGTLTPADMVWHHSLPGWLPAAQIAGLFPGAQWTAAAQPAPAGGWNAPAAAAGGVRRRRSPAVWIVPLAALVAAGLFLGLFFGLKGEGGRSGPVSQSTTTQTNGASTTEATNPPTTLPPVVGESGTWLVMIYGDADDELLEQDMCFDLNEAELVGSTDKVRIVEQLDRYVGGYTGDGDWTSTKRFLVTKDSDLYHVNSEELADLGEVDMGDGQSLYDFVDWAVRSYPAEHYALVLANHGGGWTGGWSDDSPVPGSALTTQELDDALGAVVADTGIGAFELVGFDACLMGQLEVVSAITPHAQYAVASEEIEPLVGWAYAGFLRALTENPAMTGRELGQAIVDSYIGQDVRITDDQARRELVGASASAEAVTAALEKTSTMSTIDLSAIRDLDAAANQLAVALAGVDQELVAQARTYSQSYESVFSEDYPPSFIDLGHFVDLLLADVNNADVTQAAQQVKSALARAVTSEKHGDERPGSNGLSIYFPNSTEYTGAYGSGWGISYPSSIGRFSAASLWDDYLTYHYTGETFDASAADLAVLTPALSTETDFTQAARESTPAAGAEIVGPGAGQLTIAPLTVSADQIGPDGTVSLSTKITGSNVAYVYYYVAYYYESDGSFLSADAGYVEPGSVKQIGGVYYPDWGDTGSIPVNYDWTPTLYYMSDGNEANDQFAFFQPTVYGSDVSGDVYTVRGTYTFVDTGTKIDAEIDFSGDGSMRQVWGFSNQGGGGGSGTWHEITPQKGDTFTITEEYLEFTQNPEGEFVDYDGGNMTFGDTPFTMVPYYAFPGTYDLAIGVEDMDGSTSWEFTEVTVTQ